MLPLLLLLLVLLGVLFWYQKKRGATKSNAVAAPTSPASKANSHAKKNRFRAAMVVCGKPSCAAAKAMKDKVYLSSEAPALPLQNCDQNSCQCRYKFLEDRRQGDRRSLFGELNDDTIASAGKPKRTRVDRRKKQD